MTDTRHRTPGETSRTVRAGARLSAVLAAAVVLALALAGPAAAHSDAGEMTVTSVEQTGPTTVHLEVGIVYEGDEHLAEDASVTALLTGTDGTTVGPVEMTGVSETSSLYAADVELPAPGTWAIEVTSVEPAATATATVEVVARVDTPGSETTPADGDPQIVTGDDATDSTDVTAGGAVDDYIDQAAQADEAEDDGANTTVIYLVLAVGALLVVAAVAVLRRRGGNGLEELDGFDGADDDGPGAGTPRPM